MNVSSYSPEEFPAIEPIARAAFRDFKYPGQFNWKEFSFQWQSALNAGIGLILRVEDDGILGVLFGKDPFNGWLQAMVNFWFVRPEKRHLGIGRDLLLAAEAIAHDKKCWRVLMGHPVGHLKFFEKMGYDPIEVGFQKRL